MAFAPESLVCPFDPIFDEVVPSIVQISRPEKEHRLGPRDRPTHSQLLHAIIDRVSTGTSGHPAAERMVRHSKPHRQGLKNLRDEPLLLEKEVDDQSWLGETRWTVERMMS